MDEKPQAQHKKMALGTVQFGLDYGISNTRGKVALETAREIISYARTVGIDVFDTSPSYGNSQLLLGECLPHLGTKILTKFGAISDSSITSTVVKQVENEFLKTLKELRRDSVYGLFVHGPNDLLKKGSDELFELVEKFKHRGLAEKIGVSVYLTNELEVIVDRYPIDIAQIPLSIINQEFVTSGCLSRIKKIRKIDIFARSVFLQGLLLMEPRMISDSISGAKKHLEKLHAVLEHEEWSALEAAVNYVNSIDNVDWIIYGVTDLSQFKDILRVQMRRVPSSIIKIAATTRNSIVDPRGWFNNHV